jgi:mannose-6-phosphate isomerase-like protein (cupin superfamily)
MTTTTSNQAAGLIQPAEGEELRFADVTGLLKIAGAVSGERFAAAAFPHIPPRVLAAPLHRHHREDEYTIILEGTLGVQLGEAAIEAGPGTWIVKPRNQWHTFWNPADVPCRTIEIVSPAGFEQYFQEVAAAGPDMERLVRLNARYGIDMDFDSVPALCDRFGLRFPQPAPDR